MTAALYPRAEVSSCEEGVRRGGVTYKKSAPSHLLHQPVFKRLYVGDEVLLCFHLGPLEARPVVGTAAPQSEIPFDPNPDPHKVQWRREHVQGQHRAADDDGSRIVAHGRHRRAGRHPREIRDGTQEDEREHLQVLPRLAKVLPGPVARLEELEEETLVNEDEEEKCREHDQERVEDVVVVKVCYGVGCSEA